MSDVWYRYEDVRYAPPVDEWGDPHGIGELRVELRKYDVLRVTPAGVWLAGGRNGRRFVLRASHKRWACPTPAEAAESFRQRKLRQARIHEARAARAREALNLLDDRTAFILPVA